MMKKTEEKMNTKEKKHMTNTDAEKKGKKELNNTT